MTRRRVAVAFALLALLLLAFGVWRWWHDMNQFDTQQWRSDKDEACSEGYDGARRWMVGDLRDNHLREGMTPDQVLALLGPPDKSDATAERTLLYWATSLGLTRCYYLSIKFVNARLVETDHFY